MSLVAINFYPKLGTENYPMSNIDIIDSLGEWGTTLQSYVSNGYVRTINKPLNEVNGIYFVTFKPKTGFKFNKVYKTNSSGTSNTGEFDINADGSVKVSPWTGGTASTINNHLYFDLVEDIKTEYDLIQNLENCNSSISGSKITEGVKEIILTVNKDNHVFDTIPTISIGDIVHDFTMNEDKTIASIIIDVTDDVEINAVARENIKVFITGTIENATCNYSDSEFIDKNKNIIISAIDGYTFKGNYSYREGVMTKQVTNKDTYLEIKTSNLSSNITLNSVYNATRNVEQIGTFVNLYKTNETELSELSKVRFYESAGQITDYGTYINTLYILPFELPSDLIGDTGSIILGKLDSKVNSKLLITYLYELDGGSIQVPLKYNNIYDYVNVECILHIPFLDKIYLNTEYVIGQTITLDFTIDLYSGNLTVNVKSSFTNEIIASVQGLIGMNIPFIQKSSNSVISSISKINKNKIDRCFIEVNRNIPYTKGKNIFGGQVIEFGKIGDYTGYLECDNLVLKTNASNQEQEEIKNILRNGVFINE